MKDIIIRGGENVREVLCYCRFSADSYEIASTEVENALYADPRVSEAVAIAVPDDRLGERVGTIVSLRAGQWATEEELREAVKPRSNSESSSPYELS